VSSPGRTLNDVVATAHSRPAAPTSMTST
jgi:hypothetical protein